MKKKRATGLWWLAVREAEERKRQEIEAQPARHEEKMHATRSRVAQGGDDARHRAEGQAQG
jgi:hypothetical protein